MMKLNHVITLIIGLLAWSHGKAQSEQIVTTASKNWTAFNRNVEFENGEIHLDNGTGYGVLWLKEVDFRNGLIELDIKGKNTPGKSFVGIAFHGLDNQTFDAFYFRPFNFNNLSRNIHSIQYVSMPENDWSVLRNTFPGKYENSIAPVPEPVDTWFHVKIEIMYPSLLVYVNGSEEATLQVEQISERDNGKIGLWVGNGSEGWFKNLTLISVK